MNALTQLCFHGEPVDIAAIEQLGGNRARSPIGGSAFLVLGPAERKLMQEAAMKSAVSNLSLIEDHLS